MTYYNRITTCLAQNKLSAPGGWLDNNSDGSSADGGDSGQGSAASGGGASAASVPAINHVGAGLEFNGGDVTGAYPFTITPGDSVIIFGGYSSGVLTEIVDSDANVYDLLYNANGVFIAFLSTIAATPATLTAQGTMNNGGCYCIDATPVTPGAPVNATVHATPNGAPFSLPMPAPYAVGKMFVAVLISTVSDPSADFDNTDWGHASLGNGVYVTFIDGTTPSANNDFVTTPSAGPTNMISVAEIVFS